MATNRIKRSLVLDLTKPEGRDALFRVVATADVFLLNIRPKVARKIAIDRERFTDALLKLVFIAAYGFRNEGPLDDNPTYDDIIQAAIRLADLQSVAPRVANRVCADNHG